MTSNKEGVLVIKAQQYRTQDKNREDALTRLLELIRSVLIVEKTRRPTKPTHASKQRRLDGKSKRSQVKSLRNKIQY